MGLARLASLAGALLAGAFVACAPRTACAQPSAGAASRADLLFREGQALIDAGKPAEACPELEESQRLDPKLGRLLNVAYCHELVGRTASAWAEYNEAAALAAQKLEQDRVDFARHHAAALADRLSLAQLDFSQGAGDVTEVAVDGAPLARDHWGLPFPLDPGRHVLSFGASGKTTHGQEVAIAPGRGIRHIVVQPLEPEVPAGSPRTAPAEAPAPAPASPPPRSTKGEVSREGSRPMLAWIAGGVGVAGAVTGAVFLAVALSQKSQANPDCPGQKCNPQGAAKIDDARTSAWIATAGFGAGAAGAALAVWLLLTSTSSTASALAHLAPIAGGGATGLSVEAAW